MIMSGCQGKPRTPTILEKKCPQCGHDIEMFSIDTEARCETAALSRTTIRSAVYSGANTRVSASETRCTSK